MCCRRCRIVYFIDMAWGNTSNLFIYRLDGSVRLEHWIYGLSLREWVCMFLLSFVNLSTHKFLVKCSAIEWKTVCWSFKHAYRPQHKRTSSQTTIDCCHFTTQAYVYESIIIYIETDEHGLVFYPQYADFLIGISIFLPPSCSCLFSFP